MSLGPSHIEGRGQVGVALIKQSQIGPKNIMVCVTRSYDYHGLKYTQLKMRHFYAQKQWGQALTHLSVI